MRTARAELNHLCWVAVRLLMSSSLAWVPLEPAVARKPTLTKDERAARKKESKARRAIEKRTAAIKHGKVPRPPGRAPVGTAWSERRATFVPVDDGALVNGALVRPAVTASAAPLHPTMPTAPPPASMLHSAAMQLQRQVKLHEDKQEKRRQQRTDREAAMPKPLLRMVRDMWQHFGWLRGDKLRQELQERRNEPGSGKPLPPSPWLDALPSDLRGQIGNDWLQPACERLLPAALRMVRQERRAAGLSGFDRAPKKHGWRRVSEPRADGRRVLHS